MTGVSLVLLPDCLPPGDLRLSALTLPLVGAQVLTTGLVAHTSIPMLLPALLRFHLQEYPRPVIDEWLRTVEPNSDRFSPNPGKNPLRNAPDDHEHMVEVNIPNNDVDSGWGDFIPSPGVRCWLFLMMVVVAR